MLWTDWLDGRFATGIDRNKGCLGVLSQTWSKLAEVGFLGSCHWSD